VLRWVSRLYAGATARRVARSGWVAPVPVICCGNAGAGGSGKTPLALELAGRLAARGRRVAFLSRGHGGRLSGVRVEPSRHGAADVGDEPLLLAGVAPTYVGVDRAASARAAIADGADVLVMDDGLQNPGLVKNLSLLVVDGGAGFGNGAVIPAGPLREGVAQAASRCAASVVIGADVHGAGAMTGLPILRARLRPGAVALPERIVAFAGIGRPGKFFASLAEAGHVPLATLEFPDHHLYRPADLARIHALAAAHQAVAVTTQKDQMRLAERFLTLPVELVWDDPAGIEALLDGVLA
jgi:tetraacyldisaccharide 4'-kinase